MIGWNKFDDDYFLKYGEKRVKLRPFDPKQTEIALSLIEEIKKQTSQFDNLKLLVRGSTAFKIIGKGDIEIGVYPQESEWQQVIARLTEIYRNPDTIENDYVRFSFEKDGYEVEIVVLKGHEAKVDIKLTEFLLNHPDLLVEYGKVKIGSSYSKREYQIQKNKFLCRVIDMIPEE